MARFRSGWANLWLEFKWIIEIHRIQWILSTCLWPGGHFPPAITSPVCYLYARTECSTYTEREREDEKQKDKVKMKMEYLPSRNESKMHVDYFAAIAVFLWLLFIINIWPVFVSKRIVYSVACVGAAFFVFVACSQTWMDGSVVWRGHYLISSSIKTKYYFNSKYYHLFHVMN